MPSPATTTLRAGPRLAWAAGQSLVSLGLLCGLLLMPQPLLAEGSAPLTAASAVDPALGGSVVTLPIAPVAPSVAPPVAAEPAPAAVVPQAAPQGAPQAASQVAPPAASQVAATPPAIKPKPKLPPAPPRETALPTTPTPALTPATVQLTTRALTYYQRIESAGGWEATPQALHPGATGPRVVALRRRLAIEGDLDAELEASAATNPRWDRTLTEAVKHFQVRMGLVPTGHVAGATLKALNVPVAKRLQQLQASLARLKQLNFAFGDRYVVVNIPSASVEAVERGQVAHRYVAVVGDREHRSPQVTARVQAVNLNPTWTVPVSIIKNEIIPHMRKDPAYLARAHIRILDGKGKEIEPTRIDWSSERAINYILRQDSGAGNSLGAIRINMPNKEAVYMHDTPSKRFFGLDDRFLSHGCVRVQGVYDLASWLLEGTLTPEFGPWDKAALLTGIASQARIDIKLNQSVPVAWVYLTGFGDGDGNVQFRDDVYGLDAEPDTFANMSGPVVRVY